MRLLAGIVFVLALLLQPALADDVVLSVQSAKMGFDEISAQPSVQVTLAPKAAKLLAALTLENVGNIIELRVDGELLTSPVVQTPILGGELVISGALTMAEAKALAERLAEKGASITLTPIAR